MPKHKISSLIVATTLLSLTVQYKELVNASADAQTDMSHKLKGSHLVPKDQLHLFYAPDMIVGKLYSVHVCSVHMYSMCMHASSNEL